MLSPEVTFNDPATAPRCWTHLSSKDLRYVQARSVSFHWTTCDRDCPQTEEIGQGKLKHGEQDGHPRIVSINHPASDTYFFTGAAMPGPLWG